MVVASRYTGRVTALQEAAYDEQGEDAAEGDEERKGRPESDVPDPVRALDRSWFRDGLARPTA
jgi:hypothetical protein